MFEGSHLFGSGSLGELDKMQRFAEMTSLLGPPPEEFRKRTRESSEYWDENGRCLRGLSDYAWFWAYMRQVIGRVPSPPRASRLSFAKNS